MMPRLILTVFLVVAATTQSQDAFCDAKSWASIVADTPTPPETVVKHTAKEDPTIQKQQRKLSNRGTGSLHVPGVYASLPTDATKYTVRNVYDGDTLTLTNSKRVRFLGIDTPELVEKQAFAPEAKQYAKDYCHRREIYLTFPSDEKEDKYGRWLALVWVPLESGYMCVNEGLVSEGLATVYLAKKNTRLPNLRKMLILQRKARTAGRGIWSNFRDLNVVATKFGSAYHKPTCRHVRQSRNLRPLKASEATDQGLHPCRTCLADM